MPDHILEFRLLLPASRERVFEFFATPENLAAITPGWLGFTLLTPGPITVTAGTVLDYRIRWLGLPLRWRSLIREYDPPFRFVDVQVIGPYARWEHRHMFLSAEGGTVVEDRVTYRLPLGPAGQLAHRLCVRRQLESIFAYRQDRLGFLLARPPGGSS
jgi:ligand-binding SRPBCC domain-containing protein